MKYKSVELNTYSYEDDYYGIIVEVAASMCEGCGSLVFDTEKHTEWHDKIVWRYKDV